MTALMAGWALRRAVARHRSETQRPFARGIVGGIVSATIFTCCAAARLKRFGLAMRLWNARRSLRAPGCFWQPSPAQGGEPLGIASPAPYGQQRNLEAQQPDLVIQAPSPSRSAASWKRRDASGQNHWKTLVPDDRA